MPTESVRYDFTANVSSFNKAIGSVIKGFDKIALSSKGVATAVNTAFKPLATQLSHLTTYANSSADKLEKLKSNAATSAGAVKQLGTAASGAFRKLESKSGGAVTQLGRLRDKARDAATSLGDSGRRMSATLGHTKNAMQTLRMYTQDTAGAVNYLGATARGAGNQVTSAFVNLSTKTQTARRQIEMFGKSFAAQTKNNARFTVQMADSITKIDQVTSKLVSNMNRLERQTEKNHKAFNKFGGNVGVLRKLVLGFKNLVYGAMAVKTIAAALSSSKDYIENVNLFAVTMAGAADKAELFMNRLRDIGNLDPNSLMRMQGTYNILAKSLGVGIENANTLSEGLTQATIDISSLWNLPIEEVQRKLSSGIVGYSRAVRDLGIDVSLNALENEAMLEGLNVNVRTLDQASKMQLRYNAIMRQSKVAQGDFARTIEQPANQLRILKEQWQVMTRNLGNVFLPFLARIVPYLTAAVKLLGRFFEYLATLVGFAEIYKQAFDNAKIAGELKSYSEDMEEGADATNDLVEAIRELQSFDELNVLGSGKLGSGAEGSLNLLLESYNMNLEKIGQLSNDLVNQFLGSDFYNKLRIAWNNFTAWLIANDVGGKLKEIWDYTLQAIGWVADALVNIFKFIRDNWNWIAPVLEGILVGILAFKAIETVKDIIAGVTTALAVLGTTAGLVAIAIGVVFASFELISGYAEFPTYLWNAETALRSLGDAVTPWSQAYEAAKGLIQDVTTVVGEHGETLESVSKQIKETEDKITAIYSNATEERRNLNKEELLDIEKYLEELGLLQLQKLELYRLNTEAVAIQIQAQLTSNKLLTEQERAELQKQLDTVYTQLNAARQSAEQSELAQLLAYRQRHKEMTDETFNERKQQIIDKYAEYREETNKQYGEQLSDLIAYNKDYERLVRDSYLEIARRNALMLDEKMALEARLRELNDAAIAGQGADAAEVSAIYGRLEDLEKEYADFMKTSLADRNKDADEAYLTQIAMLHSRGIELTDEQKFITSNILEAYQTWANEMYGPGKESYVQLVQGMMDYLPEAENIAKLGTQDIADMIRLGLGIDANGYSNKLAQYGYFAFDSVKQGFVSGTTLLKPQIQAAIKDAYASPTQRKIMEQDAYDMGLAAGIDMVSGLEYGTKDKASRNKLYMSLEEMATSSVAKFRYALGIESPSKVFMSLGEMIPLGIAKGIDSTAGRVQTAINNLPMNTSFTTSAAFNAVPVAGVGSASVGSNMYNVPNGGVSEDLLYNAVVRAMREMPQPVLNLDGEVLATATAGASNTIYRRYNK